jgi:hypothetical protein
MPDQSPWARPEDDAPESTPEPPAAETIPGARFEGQHLAPPRPAEPTPAEPASAPEPAAEDAEPVLAKASSGPEPSPHPAPPRRDSSGSTVIAILGMMLLVLSALIAGLIAFVTQDDDGGQDYPVNLDNDDYDLAAMAIRNRDTPAGLELVGSLGFDNTDWAILLDEADPEPRLAQLEAQQRVRNHVSVFSWEPGGSARLGEVLNLLSQSTLYETEEAAAEAIRGSALCGLNIPLTSPVEDFDVPTIADQSVGFYVEADTVVIDVDEVTQEQTVARIIETVVCFRTGRVVHGVVQRAWDGSQDPNFVIGLARDMLTHVDNTFGGVDDPLDTEEEEGG